MLIAIGIGFVSLALIYLEFFLPGAILGILGGIAYVASLLLFIWASGDFLSIALYLGVMVILLIGTVKYALWKLKQKPSFFPRDAQSGYMASTYDKELIGKEGVALTDLKPSGHILALGEQHQAVSERSYIKKGESIMIIGGEGARLIVRRK